jgi:serine/threonine protein kinase
VTTKWYAINLRPLSGTDDGGFGVLQLADRSDGGAPVVVKFVRDAEDAGARQYLAREHRILSLRLHPRLVPVLGGEPNAPRPYYIMPYYRRGSLLRWAGRLRHDQLRLATREICEAVEALHNADIIHGDVKPHNVMVGDDNHLYVGDPLGNGSGCTVTPTAKNRGGTPAYMSPEIAAGGPMSKKADVFAIGATLSHLVTGVIPEQGMTFDLRASGYVVPDDLHAIVCAATRTNPILRPTISQLLAALNGQIEALNIPIVVNTNADPTGALIAGGIVVGAILLAAALSKK